MGNDMTESKPMTLDVRASSYAYAYCPPEPDVDCHWESRDAFKAGWKECFDWVVLQLTISNRDTAGLSDLIEKHKREIGE